MLVVPIGCENDCKLPPLAPCGQSEEYNHLILSCVQINKIPLVASQKPEVVLLCNEFPFYQKHRTN
jgi:hypothetical protein